MKFATRESMEKVVRRFEDVEIPEYDLMFRVQEMSGTARDDFEIAVIRSNPSLGNGQSAKPGEVNPKYLRARLLCLCLVDEEGKRLYKNNEVEVLSDLIPASVQGKLFSVAQRINGLDAVAVEAATKNSSSGLEDGLPSGSPSPSEKPSLNS